MDADDRVGGDPRLEVIIAASGARRGEHGELDGATAAQMAARGPGAELVTIPGAGHELRLEAPRQWRSAFERFLDSAAA